MKALIITGLLMAGNATAATAAPQPSNVTRESVEILRGQLDGFDRVATQRQLLDAIERECASIGGTVTDYHVTATPSSLGFKFDAEVTCRIR
ncbi:hypothetical protein [Luteibacter sp. ME-Dv--P-043b]|uniref:hypothetical protein n=1 Tax=Luteibacter sp. ME-Dv--P-043b TaxID=3040291 RepID=UPI0025539C41|nr:hypothetical protein [Luteibacter sp. ME-Dv--P-043b]